MRVTRRNLLKKLLLTAAISAGICMTAGPLYVSAAKQSSVVTDTEPVFQKEAAGETKQTAAAKETAKEKKQPSAAKQPVSISLNKTSVSNFIGVEFRLKAVIKPKAAADAKVTWKSSNEKVAAVDSNGKVTLQGAGNAKITARTKNGKTASCNVNVVQYRISGRTAKIGTPEGVKTYHAYAQKDYGYGYYRNYGCVTTATAIIASAYGLKYTPVDIHAGPATKKYSERYAVIKMGKESALKDWYGRAALSLRTASEILKNMGIENRVVYSYDRAEAVKEIREHLKEGKPVIIKANNNTYQGKRLANLHHAVVLIGVDAQDHAICISPNNPTYYTTITLNTLLYHHMTPASGHYKRAYMIEMRTAGGYILVDGPETSR